MSAKGTPPPPDHLTQREAQIIEQAFWVLTREPAFRSMTNLFAARKAEKQDVGPLQKAFEAEAWKSMRRAAQLE